MHRPPKNRAVRSASVSLPRGWEFNLVVIIKVEVNIGKEVMVIIIKKFIVEICALEPNLFKLVTHVSYYRGCKQELKLITTYLTIL